MNYTPNTKSIFGSIALAIAFVFIVGLASAPTAHAQFDISFDYGYGGGYDSGYGYDGYDSGYYGGDTTYVYTGCDSSCGGSYGSYGGGYNNYPAPVHYPAPTPLPPTNSPVTPIQISCYPMPLTANVGDSATWASSVYGGTGSYSYTWSGSDGLIGGGPSISKVYYTSGVKSATLTVTSGGRTQTQSCSGSVNVYNNNSYNYPVYTNPAPVYNPPVQYYSPLSVSCNAATTYAQLGGSVTWTAYASGGNGGYNYSWTGSDSLYGYGQSIYRTYTNPGYKTAIVTVTSNGQSVSANCTNTVNVGGYQNIYPIAVTPIQSNNNGLDIGCYTDPTSATINQPVTWSVEVTGGRAPYTYSWSGSDGLSGSSASLVKYYDSYGSKSAVVSVTSADGKTGTRACSNALTIKRPGGTAPTTVTPAPTNTNNSNNGLGASAFFSLQNVPWGWVALLIILVLFATVLYLIFNRPKI